MNLKNLINQQLFFRLGEYLIGTKTLQYYRLIKEMETWSRNQIEEWQTIHLKRLIDYAYNHSIYYNQLFRSIGITSNDITSLSDLNHIPKLTKVLIRENWEDIITNPKNFKYKISSSGGSTGEPLKYIVSYDSWSFLDAFNLAQWEQIGYKMGDKYIAFGSSSLFPTKRKPIKHKLYYLLKGKIPVNGILFTDAEYQKVIEIIKQHKVKFIYGYASSVFLLCDYILRNGIKLPFMRGVVTTSEMLLDEYALVIERALNVPIIDAYGSADGGVCAYKQQGGIFRVGYNCIVESENSQKESHSPILLTDLLNLSFPFIRYENGDEVEINPATEHDYNGQHIDRLLGRIPDLIRLGNGRTLTGPGFTILFRDMNVLAYRIIQTDQFSIMCEIQKSEIYSDKNESLIREELLRQIGPEIKIDLIYKDNFTPLPNGKRNYFLVQK